MHQDQVKSAMNRENAADHDGVENVGEQGQDHEINPEKIEEMKLRAKFPQAVRGPPSAFLQKRLQQRKFFDSGDYNMAKAKGLKLPVQPATSAEPMTPVKQPTEALSISVDDVPTSPTGTEIPTPEKVPARKTSLVQATASKLSPHPVVHHSPTSPLENSTIETN